MCIKSLKAFRLRCKPGQCVVCNKKESATKRSFRLYKYMAVRIAVKKNFHAKDQTDHRLYCTDTGSHTVVRRFTSGDFHTTSPFRTSPCPPPPHPRVFCQVPVEPSVDQEPVGLDRVRLVRLPASPDPYLKCCPTRMSCNSETLA